MNKLESLLRNEPDIAFRNRVHFIVKELKVEPTDKILEVGCGRGFILNILSALFTAEFHGIDIAKDHLAIARKQLKNRNVKLKYASVYELPYPDNSFDKIVSTEVLEHLEHEDKALGEIRRVLKPGGKLIVTVPNKKYPFLWDPINKTLETVFGTHVKKGMFSGIWAHHVRLYGKKQLKSVLEKNNFTVRKLIGSTHYCFPFSHNIVYGIGKTLQESNLLPHTVVNAVDRFSYNKNSHGFINPINWVLTLFNTINRLNLNRDFERSVCLHATVIKK